MTRVYIVVEGQTEEAFVNDLLSPALWAVGIIPAAILIGRPGHRGGAVTFNRVVEHLGRLLKGDGDAYCTTLLDYYGRGPGFPVIPSGRSPAEAVELLEGAVSERLSADIPTTRVDVRCLPYFQLHEFEALLFSDPAALARGFYRDDLAAPLDEIRKAFGTPEDINDSPLTAPSKRIEQLSPDYGRQKPLLGTLAALSVGLPAMRRVCPRFGRWVDRLLSLAEPPGDL